MTLRLVAALWLNLAAPQVKPDVKTKLTKGPLGSIFQAQVEFRCCRSSFPSVFFTEGNQDNEDEAN
jgi:hypothetical protein